MASSVPAVESVRHHRLPDLAGAPAKVRGAEVRKADPDAWRLAIAAVVVQVKGGLTLKEFADKVDRGERQVARWLTAEDRPQFDAIFAVPQFRRPALVALARLAGEGVEVETVVRIQMRGARE